MTSAARAPAVRDEAIDSPSAREEFVAVVRAAMAVVFLTWLYLASDPFAAGGTTTARGLLPFQSFIRDRPADDQRMFRELQAALLEIERVRSDEGAWPTTEALAADGVEPFAVNPAIKGPRYSWRVSRAGRTLNYVGVPDRPGTAWLVWVQEPDPAAPEVFRPDEEHHQLLDGSVLHVSTWSRADPRVPDTTSVAPQFEGWTQLYAVTAPAAQPPR